MGSRLKSWTRPDRAGQRPGEPVDDPKTERLSARFTESEIAGVRQKAAEAGLTVSEYLRRAALSRKIVSRYDAEFVRHLSNLHANFRRIGGLFRWWLTGAPDKWSGEQPIQGAPTDDQRARVFGILHDLSETQKTIEQAVKLILTDDINARAKEREREAHDPDFERALEDIGRAG